MKQSVFFPAFFLVLLVMGACNQSGKAPAQEQTALADSPAPENNQSGPVASAATDLPPLPLLKLDGTSLMANQLNGKIILYFFQPDCDHCQRETGQIRENLAAFRDYQVYFISNYPQQTIAKFAQDYKLAFEPNFVFAHATINDILNTVGPMESPSMFIYAADGRLVKNFNGETPIQEILPALQP